MELRFLYIGSSDTARELSTWLALPGAELRWRFAAFGADVAAVDVGPGPLLLLADHRPPGSVLPIYAVPDLDGTTDTLEAAGWRVVTGPAGTPEGAATVFSDGDGTELAFLRVDRPGAMDAAYADDTNPWARPAP